MPDLPKPPPLPPTPRSAVSAPTPPAKKKSYFVLKLAIFSTLAAGGAGYYAYTVRGEREDATKSLIAKNTAYDICQKDLDQTKAQTAALGGEVTKTTVEREREKAAKEEKERKLSETEGNLEASNANLQASKAELEELRKQHAESEKRIAAFKELTAKFQKMIDTGKLQVMFREGRMIVKLPAGVLFESGKAELSKDGEMAIMEVAVVLKQFPDRKFMVVGHTDSVPLKNSTYKDNWELSTARAVQVTEFLIGAGLKPESLLAAGYGQYDPVKSNKTEAGRKENRRIEIVVLPNIDELPSLPEMAAAGAAKPETP